jgi:hypothetical protein
MVRYWTNHWLHRSWRGDVNAEYEPICHAASNNFRRRGVSPGDIVYIVSLADGQLFLGGRMTVQRIVSREQAARIQQTDNLYEGEEHIIGEEGEGTPLNLHRILAPAISRQLQFVSSNSNPKSLFFHSDTHLYGQATRGIRELTPDSAALLDRIIAVTDGLAISHQVITVTEELIRDGTTREGIGEISVVEKIPEDATFSEESAQRTFVDRSEPQYWVAGAMWGGSNDQFEIFIREGYWLLGWEDEDQPIQARRRDQIRPGDRIAIKKRSAGNKSKIEIRATGFVTGIDSESHRVFVRWVASDLHHEVPSRGCFASIHGPFSGGDDWIRRVFQLEQGEHRLEESELPDLDDEFNWAPEGGRRWRLHLVIERNREIVKRKKAQVKSEKGLLECEACGFIFAKVYGDLGADFCEVHHRLALTQLDEAIIPKLADLAIVCSNCHRIIHRTKPMMPVEDFRDKLKTWCGTASPD